jgi:hypothetical protein
MDIREAVRFGFSEYLVSDTPLDREELAIYGKTRLDYYKRLVFAFPNGYKVSVIRTPGSYGHENGDWEAAIIWNDRICYDSGIAEDVIGYLDPQGVNQLLRLAMTLTPRIPT